MTYKPAFALLLTPFACLLQLSAANPQHASLHALHGKRSPLDGAITLHLSEDPQIKPEVDGRVLSASDSESLDASPQEGASRLHDHSGPDDSDLDELLDQVGLSSSNDRGLVKRQAAGQRNMNVVYYAQTPATSQVPLTEICADPTIDVVILSFITDFYSAGGYPTVSLSTPNTRVAFSPVTDRPRAQPRIQMLGSQCRPTGRRRHGTHRLRWRRLRRPGCHVPTSRQKGPPLRRRCDRYQ